MMLELELELELAMTMTMTTIRRNWIRFSRVATPPHNKTRVHHHHHHPHLQ